MSAASSCNSSQAPQASQTLKLCALIEYWLLRGACEGVMKQLSKHVPTSDASTSEIISDFGVLQRMYSVSSSFSSWLRTVMILPRTSIESTIPTER